MRLFKRTKRTRTALYDTDVVGDSFSHGQVIVDGVDRGTRLSWESLGYKKPSIELELSMLETRRLAELLNKRVAEFEARIDKTLAAARLPNIQF